MRVRRHEQLYATLFLGNKAFFLFEEGEILFSAGMYGIYRFDADDTNLLTE